MYSRNQKAKHSAFHITSGWLTGDREALIKLGAQDLSVGGNLIREFVEGKREADTNKVINAASIQRWQICISLHLQTPRESCGQPYGLRNQRLFACDLRAQRQRQR
jgi:hypothetical protein